MGRALFGVANYTVHTVPRLDLGQDLSTTLGDAVRPGERCLASSTSRALGTRVNAVRLGLMGLCLGPAAEAACSCLRPPFADAARRRVTSGINFGHNSSTIPRASSRAVSARPMGPPREQPGYHRPALEVHSLFRRVLVPDLVVIWSSRRPKPIRVDVPGGVLGIRHPKIPF